MVLACCSVTLLFIIMIFFMFCLASPWHCRDGEENKSRELCILLCGLARGKKWNISLFLTFDARNEIGRIGKWIGRLTVFLDAMFYLNCACVHASARPSVQRCSVYNCCSPPSEPDTAGRLAPGGLGDVTGRGGAGSRGSAPLREPVRFFPSWSGRATEEIRYELLLLKLRRYSFFWWVGFFKCCRPS